MKYFVALFAVLWSHFALSAELKVWTIAPVEWNGVIQTPKCHDGHFFWDTVTQPFTNPEGVPIRIHKIRIEAMGAAGMVGDYASRLWIQAPGQPSQIALTYGREIYSGSGNQDIVIVDDLDPNWITMPANAQFWFRWECGYFPQMGPSTMDNHLFFPGYTIYYSVP